MAVGLGDPRGSGGVGKLVGTFASFGDRSGLSIEDQGLVAISREGSGASAITSAGRIGCGAIGTSRRIDGVLAC